MVLRSIIYIIRCFCLITISKLFKYLINETSKHISTEYLPIRISAKIRFQAAVRVTERSNKINNS